MTVHSFPTLKRVKGSYLSALLDKTVINHFLFLFSKVFFKCLLFPRLFIVSFLLSMKPNSDLVLSDTVSTS